MQGLEHVKGQKTATVMNVSLRRDPGGLGERGQLGCRDVGGVFPGGDARGSQEDPPMEGILCHQTGDAGQEWDAMRNVQRPSAGGGSLRGSERLGGGWTKPPGWGLEPEGSELDVRPRCKVLGAERSYG